jgi:hypothetical protein
MKKTHEEGKRDQESMCVTKFYFSFLMFIDLGKEEPKLKPEQTHIHPVGAGEERK